MFCLQPIQREPKVFAPLIIPKSLQKALPYKVKPKHGPVGGAKRIETKRIAVVREPHEQKVESVLFTLLSVKKLHMHAHFSHIG